MEVVIVSTRSEQACTLVIVRYRVALETNIRHGLLMDGEQ